MGQGCLSVTSFTQQKCRLARGSHLGRSIEVDVGVEAVEEEPWLVVWSAHEMVVRNSISATRSA
jgi:hypothetical protein|eukprot:4362922-Prymnesium_polylepis.1